MKRRKLTDILVCILTLLLVFSGGLCGCYAADSNQDGSGTDGTSKTVSSAGKEENVEIGQDESTLTDKSGSVIRIACWQKEPYLINLKAYLAETFPEYTIKYEYIQRDNYESVIDSQLSYNGAADIIFVTQKMTSKYARAGYLVPVTEACYPFTGEARYGFAYRDNVYAVPSVSIYECFYYNKDLYEEYGLSMPTSYDSFLSICDDINRSKPGRAITSGLKDGERLSNCALALLADGYFNTPKGQSFGLRLRNGNASFYEELYPYLLDWEKMIDHNALSSDLYLFDMDAAIHEFAEGKSVFLVAGPEDYNYIKSLCPNMNIGTMPYGSTSGNIPVIVGGCDTGISVKKYGEHTEEALNIVKALASYDGQKALWRDSPGSKTYLTDVDFGMPKEFDEIKDVLDNFMFFPYNDWGDNSREVKVAFGEELQHVLLKKENLEEAMKKLDVKVQAIASGRE